MGIFDRTLHAARRLLTLPNAAADDPSGMPEPRATHDAVEDAGLLASASSRLEGFGFNTGALLNMITGYGTSRDSSSYNTWREPRRLDNVQRYGMGRNALIAQALGKLPNTALREGWRVDITDPNVEVEARGEASDKIAAYEARLSMQHKVARAMTRGRQYRGAFVWLGINDGQPFSAPVDTNAIKTIQWAVVIDARHYQPATLYSAKSEHYGEIETFRIVDINGILEVLLRTTWASCSRLMVKLKA